MKKHLLILSLFLAVFASCKKDNSDNFDEAAQAAKDETAIQAYLAANPNINVTKDANSSLYYQIITQGDGVAATSTGSITVNYVGKLLNGTQFGTGQGFKTSIAATVKGWQIGMTHAHVGDRILLIVPSALGYGNTSSGSGIPANSVLIFTIDVLSVN